MSDIAANMRAAGADAGHGIRFGEAFRVWLRVALLSFGGPAGQIAVMHRMLAATFALCVPAQTMAGIACKPVLAIKEVRFSEPQNQLRKWTGILGVDASRCVATSGIFEIKFVRIKEMGPDLLFSERFKWSPGLTQVSLDFWWDEAVLEYWIGEVPPCGCPE